MTAAAAETSAVVASYPAGTVPPAPTLGPSDSPEDVTNRLAMAALTGRYLEVMDVLTRKEGTVHERAHRERVPEQSYKNADIPSRAIVL